MSGTIYRLLPFSRFQEVVNNQSLAFVTYDMWPNDPNEGYLLRLIEREEGRRFISLYLRDCIPDFPLGPDALFSMMERYRKSVHLQCWTACPESNLMWTAYSANCTAVRIECSLENIEQLKDVRSVPVKYREKLFPEEEMDRILGARKFDFPGIFEAKRIQFKHEEEIRLITKIDNDYQFVEPKDDRRDQLRIAAIKQLAASGQLTKEEEEQGLAQYDPSRKNIKRISIAHIDGFIRSVLAHPDADNLLIKEIEDFCNTKNISFLGKSRIGAFEF